MPVVDHILNSLIKYLQKKQKAWKHKKSKKAKRLTKKSSRRIKKKSSKKRIRKVESSKGSPKEKPSKNSVPPKPPRPFRAMKNSVQAKRKKHVSSNKKQVKPKRPAKIKNLKAGKVNVKKTKSENNYAEVCIGEITHYFSRIQVVVLRMTHGSLTVGEKIHIKGKQTDFVQKVRSLQIESVDVKSAKKGQLAGLEVGKKSKPGDKVFKVK